MVQFRDHGVRYDAASVRYAYVAKSSLEVRSCLEPINLSSQDLRLGLTRVKGRSSKGTQDYSFSDIRQTHSVNVFVLPGTCDLFVHFSSQLFYSAWSHPEIGPRKQIWIIEVLLAWTKTWRNTTITLISSVPVFFNDQQIFSLQVNMQRINRSSLRLFHVWTLKIRLLEQTKYRSIQFGDSAHTVVNLYR